MKNYILVNPLKEQRIDLSDEAAKKLFPEPETKPEPKTEPETEPESPQRSDFDPDDYGVKEGENYITDGIVPAVLRQYFPMGINVFDKNSKAYRLFSGTPPENMTLDVVENAIRILFEESTRKATDTDVGEVEPLSANDERLVVGMSALIYAAIRGVQINKLMKGRSLLIQRAVKAGLDNKQIIRALGNLESKQYNKLSKFFITLSANLERYPVLAKYLGGGFFQGVWAPAAMSIINRGISASAIPKSSRTGIQEKVFGWLGDQIPTAKDLDVKVDTAIIRSLQGSIDTSVDFGDQLSQKDIKQL